MDAYDQILSALEAEERIMLATIISTTGSTPAAALSKMLVKQGGVLTAGTIGGGCMEGDVLLHANRLLQTGKSEILTFHLNEDDVEHGLICGGSLEVLIEPVTRAEEPLYQALKALRENGQDAIVATILTHEGSIGEKYVIDPSSSDDSGWKEIRTRFPASTASGEGSQQQLNFPDALRRVQQRNETLRLRVAEGELILEPVAGHPRLIIFGGGHVSKFVVRTAALVGFRTTILDDREQFANRRRFPDAHETIVADFEHSFEKLSITASTYIVIVTRGHHYDELILEKALSTPARYIGMIGSRRKVLTAFRHLIERGIPPDALRRVHAPVGIDLGAITAEEIAVSIVAQLIRIRRGVPAPLHDMSDAMANPLSDLLSSQR